MAWLRRCVIIRQSTFLHIVEHTVKMHVMSILRKIGVNDRPQAVVAAIQKGWIKVEIVCAQTTCTAVCRTPSSQPAPTLTPASSARSYRWGVRGRTALSCPSSRGQPFLSPNAPAHRCRAHAIHVRDATSAATHCREYQRVGRRRQQYAQRAGVITNHPLPSGIPDHADRPRL